MKRLFLAMVATGIFGWGAPAAATCLVRPFKDANEVDRPFVVVVPPAEEKDYADRGYQPIACGAVDLAAYRKDVCDLMAAANSAVQNRIEDVLGFTPKKLCASATLATATSISASDENGVADTEENKEPAGP